jgi:photosystem II stability/assembly factor-like uncharacterized protein
MRHVVTLSFILCVLLGMSIVGLHPVRAGTFQEWTSFNDGLWSSQITCLYREPNGVLLAGTNRDGIYATQDSGMHWQWSGQGLPNLGTVMEPEYGSVLSLTTGGAQNAVYAATRTGLYVSQDAGGSWVPVDIGLSGITVYSVAVDPLAAQTILAGTDNGVYMSSDGGRSWTARNSSMAKVIVTGFVYDLAMKDGLFACTNSGLYKSLDRGVTWHGASSGLSGSSVLCLAQDSRRAGILYAGMMGGLARSFDHGDTWAVLDGAGAGPVLSVVVDDFDSSLVGIVTGRGILVSQDSGEHWSQIYKSGDGQVMCALWEKLQPNPDVLLGTLDGLVAVSGANGVRRVQGLGSLDVTAVAHDPNTGVLYAVHGSSLLSSNGSGAWQVVENSLGNARVHGLAVDTTQPRVMYAATDYGVFRSTDAGLNWAQPGTLAGSDGLDQTWAVAADPGKSNAIYAGKSNGLYRNDSVLQQAWVFVGPPQTGPIVAVAVATRDGKTVYASNGQSLWKTTDRCATWQTANMGLPFARLTSLVADGLVLYAGSQDGVWMSSDSGQYWLRCGTGLGGFLVNAVGIGPQGRVVAGTNAGFFVSRTVQDDAGPVIQVGTPSDGTIVSSSHIRVSGSVSDSGSGVASFSINGENTVFNTQNGSFAADLVLKSGANRIVLQARDLAGNVTEVPLLVTYQYKVILQLTVGSSTMRVLPDRTVMLDSPPVILSGRTLVAIRPIIEALDGTVAWSASDRKVTIVQGVHTIALWIDKAVAVVDGRTVAIDSSSTAVVPKIISGRTMLPVRFVSEALGAQVDWDANTQRITITYSNP